MDSMSVCPNSFALCCHHSTFTGKYDDIGCEVLPRRAVVYSYGKTDKEIYQGMETKITSELCAPSKTKLDVEDEAFC